MNIKEAKALTIGTTLYQIGKLDSRGERVRWRVSGQVKTYKSDSSRVDVPLKHGMGYTKADYKHLTEYNLEEFSLLSLAQEKEKAKHKD
jgi:hypothetical protein